jgi:glycosyltransferase involved in cell wall biosynthesis
VCADFLIPRRTPLVGLVADGLKQIDAFVCIRKGDVMTLQKRFHIPPSRCMFAPFPSSQTASEVVTSEGGYIYSAGWAHRDWPTLIRALRQVECEAILSVGGNLALPEPLCTRVHALPQRSPAEGRCLMAHASLIVLPLHETELPSGPLVLLDAMAMGKAVIVSDVNGSRDYVVHGRTALLVAPGDYESLATAIKELMKNDELRQNLGSAARGDVGRRFTTRRFVQMAIDACTCMARGGGE